MKLNIPKAIPAYANEPKHQIIQQNYAEVASFHRDVWEKVVRKLFVLIAIILELPDNYLADGHAYDEESDDHLRYMLQRPHPARVGPSPGLLQGRPHRLRQPDPALLAARRWPADPHPGGVVEVRQARRGRDYVQRS